MSVLTYLDRRIGIASVCTNLPSAARPDFGVFVQRRVEAMAGLAEVRALKPVCWFPLLRPYPSAGRSLRSNGDGLSVCSRRMFYLPKVLKRLDGWWMERCVTPVLRAWHHQRPIDLIDAHFGYPEGVGCFRAGRRLGIPVFITIRGVEAAYFRQPAIGRQLVEALNGCAGVIAVSQSLKHAAVAAGVDADRIAVIPNAVDETVFHPGDRAAARRGLGLPLGAPVVISVGNLIHRKGYHVLLPAFAKVRAALPDARLAIVGGPSHEPAYPGRMQRQIRALGLEQAVVMPGAVPPGAVARWLQAADVFALASYREGCCNAVLEALACGLPVVTTPVGDNERYVAPPRNGFLVPVENAEELSAAVLRALAAEWDSQAIAASVLSRGWRDVAAAVIEFFQSRLSSSHWVARPEGRRA